MYHLISSHPAFTLTLLMACIEAKVEKLTYTYSKQEMMKVYEKEYTENRYKCNGFVFPTTGLVLGLPRTKLYPGNTAPSQMTQQFNLFQKRAKEDPESAVKSAPSAFQVFLSYSL